MRMRFPSLCRLALAGAAVLAVSFAIAPPRASYADAASLLKEIKALDKKGETSEAIKKLAARAGFHRTYVGKLERGESAATVDGIAALCNALDVTLADFFSPFDHPVGLRGPRRRRSQA